MSRTSDGQLEDSALECASRVLVRASAACASFCEHVEHNEPTTTHGVVEAAAEMRRVASSLAAASGQSLRSLYLERLRSVEASSIFRFTGVPGGECLVGAEALARSDHWENAQVAQVIHDRQFHPDVFGLSKVDQLRHYTFHTVKLAGLLVDAIDRNEWPAFVRARLADVAIFGVKLATVCNEKLPPSPIDVVACSQTDGLAGG